jgi:hypothetical protein
VSGINRSPDRSSSSNVLVQRDKVVDLTLKD